MAEKILHMKRRRFPRSGEVVLSAAKKPIGALLYLLLYYSITALP